MSEKHPAENATALIIGGEVKTVGLAVAGKLFVFTPAQMQFLLALQKLKNVHAAAISIGKDESWGDQFLKSWKFRDYLHSKLDEVSVRNGLTIDWWYQFGKWASDGYKESYAIACKECQYAGTMTGYEAETHRDDTGTLEIPCPACFKKADFDYKREPFKPTREQIGAWQELGARLIPKVERIHHAFENTEIVFETSDEK
jgi:hypothetical protein